MNRQPPKPLHPAFGPLTPDTVLTAVEDALGILCTNLCRPMNSYINRVYELAAKDGQKYVAKFYRPGRWSKAALQDEHDFLLELAEAEIPVVPPLPLLNGATLGEVLGISFAVFPKKGGRSFDEFSDDQWPAIGRLLGRAHLVGAKRAPRERIILQPDKSTRRNLDYILQGDFIPADQVREFTELAEALIAEISPLFKRAEMIRIHGDCHFSNLMHRPDEGVYLIDLDDMAVGPPVHDLWMLLPGFLQDSLAEVEMFLEGYEMFRNFDRRTLQLIEPLRAMRFIHYITWCAHQAAEDGLSRVAVDFGSHAYWQQEIHDLAEQLQRIRSMPEHTGNWF
jgi:Ser/Thr protein kinase RdoA (MazF antagonist)